MSLFSLAAALFLFILGLLLLLWGYLKLCQAKYDRVLETGQPMKKPMLPPYIVANGMKVLLAAALLFMLLPVLGASTSRRELEEEVCRRAERDGMSVALALTEDTAAALYYAADGSDHSFALYENRGAWREDYRFIHGGSATSIDENLRAFRMEKTGELALFSMNRIGIARITCHSGEEYLLDPEAPFVLILPGGGADFYDAVGDRIDPAQNSWYEITVKD